MEKIPLKKFRDIVDDSSVPDSEIAQYLTVDPSSGGPFAPRVIPDRRRVEFDPEGEFDENAMGWANGVNRARRQGRFKNRISAGSTLPVLVSEGDSWFQFPFLIRDVVDQLEDEYLIWSLDAAGDTLQNMVERSEYIQALNKQKNNGVQAFLFSAAGNDVIGEDSLGNPALGELLKPFKAGEGPESHIDMHRMNEVMTTIEEAYREVVAKVRANHDFTELPILIHGYDYAIPGGFNGDNRDPIWAAQDRWLGSVLQENSISDTALQSGIVRFLIDELYRALQRVAGDSRKTHVHLVDLRGVLPNVRDWADEIHPTNNGFRRIAARFSNTLKAIDIG